MKPFTALLSATVLLAGCLLQSACAEPRPVTGPVYDFDWRMSGAAEVRPYQVFDDGQRIYLQFDDPKHVPAIFADTPGGLVLLRWRPDPPYIVVDRVDSALVFRGAGSQARAVRTTRDSPPRMAHFGAARPSKDTTVSVSERIDSTSPGAVSPLLQDK
ncbi:TrbG/VirB9 family P-type conjugative transfer protein [Burkholderia cenocepacia]|uniref:TrbG/VirB9 family P-type conjugative transfer protein n=1 Tax=Burkholderia cenocepacia TaxID=95486 RepID=UPI00285F99B2|nr:TrbG/VirB9 family P-type conjugative transfer protein [Burkholderia cenocepacia]MDR5646441.1 TrbG/VirB9 family P-type conjugative transfer protein [Burkholderia cenocepacia]